MGGTENKGKSATLTLALAVTDNVAVGAFLAFSEVGRCVGAGYAYRDGLALHRRVKFLGSCTNGTSD